VASPSVWRDRYATGSYASNGRTYGVGCGVDDRDGIAAFVADVGSGSIRRKGYRVRNYANRNGCNNRVARSVDDCDGAISDVIAVLISMSSECRFLGSLEFSS